VDGNYPPNFFSSLGGRAVRLILNRSACYIYGPRIRRMSKYAREADDMGKKMRDRAKQKKGEEKA
jgi:hypothetical protein